MIGSLGACFAEFTPRVNLIMKNVRLKRFREDALILCGINKPFSLRLKCHTSQPLIDVCLHHLFGFKMGISNVTVLTSKQY